MLIKCKVIEQFNLNKFSELKNIKRASALTKEGTLYINDTFECDKKMLEYLTGKNEEGKTVVKIVEYDPQFDN